MNQKNIPLVIETRDLTRIYGNEDNEVRALDHVNLKVKQGEFVSVMGPSGSGKSTLLNMLGALDQPTGGSVFINGQDLSTIKNIDVFRSKSVGFVFQLHNLIPTLTSRENVEVPMSGTMNSNVKKKRAGELLELVGLADRMDYLPGQLSGGQRQRVAIARALANDPPLVLADEPTGSLDSVSGEEIIRLMGELNESQGTTFAIVTHDQSVAQKTKRIIIMRDGQILQEHLVGTRNDEDLKMWRLSNLGQQIMNDDKQITTDLNLTRAELKILRRLLSRNNS